MSDTEDSGNEDFDGPFGLDLIPRTIYYLTGVIVMYTSEEPTIDPWDNATHGNLLALNFEEKDVGPCFKCRDREGKRIYVQKRLFTKDGHYNATYFSRYGITPDKAFYWTVNGPSMNKNKKLIVYWWHLYDEL